MRLIDADEAIEMVGFDDFAETLNMCPTADAEPVVHAHWWIGYFHDRVCSNCSHPGNYMPEPAFNYCPHCGAKMDGEENV